MTMKVRGRAMDYKDLPIPCVFRQYSNTSTFVKLKEGEKAIRLKVAGSDIYELGTTFDFSSVSQVILLEGKECKDKEYARYRGFV
jgi:hypothetical protein